MSIDCEQSLVEQARYDTQAFRQLYDRYFPKVYAYVGYRVVRVQDVEDLVGAVFLKVIEGIDRFEWRHDNSFAAWLFRIAHNAVSNFQRDNRQDVTTISVTLAELPDIPSSALLPDALLERKEIFVRLHGLVADLPLRRREVITLKYFGELRNSEIAVVLGIDERTVASNLSRALDDLYQKYRAGNRSVSEDPENLETMS